MAKSTAFNIATASDFDTTEIIQLPSQIGTDKAVKLRKPDVFELISGDDAPDILTDLALRQIDGGGKVDLVITKETLPQLLKTLNLIASAAWVEPEGVDPTQLSINDRMFIFNWVLGAEYEAAEAFRGESNSDADVVPTK